MVFVKFNPYKKRDCEGTPAASAAPAASMQKPLSINDLSTKKRAAEVAARCCMSAAQSEMQREMQHVQQRAAKPVTTRKPLVSNGFEANAAGAADAAGVPSESEILVPREVRETFETSDIKTPKPSPCDVAAARIESWLRGIDALPKQLSPFGERLRAMTADFWRGPWAYAAIQAGWTDGEIFSLNGGLIPELVRRQTETITFVDVRIKRFIVGGCDHPWWLDQQFKRGEL